tara:strand:- start:3894 stop:4268 length:375 start_codon:yes stop_codon:yes gene_type:complete
MIGVTIELVFNAIRTTISRKSFDLSLKGSASIWMIPIYGFGLTYGFDFIRHCIEHQYLRWLSYPVWIWAAEVIIGIPTKNTLWDYSDIKYNWRGVVSLKHYPAWLIFGIIIENARLYTDSVLLQ